MHAPCVCSYEPDTMHDTLHIQIITRPCPAPIPIPIPLLLLACTAIQADILMVTDGEISPPSEALLNAVRDAHEELGLEVHGLIVSSQVSDAMEQLCTHLHVFKSWTAVGGESWMY